MQILSRPCGVYRTNCYVIKSDASAVIIDPGDGAHEWIKRLQLPAVAAILNTHGHYDHIADNAPLAREFNCPIYAPRDDIFMLANPEGFEPSDALATAVEPDSAVNIEGFGEFKFFYCPGHTPGSSTIAWQQHYFTGDFLFSNTIGRCDFAYSSPADMRVSLQNAIEWLQPEFALHPGHGLGCKAAQVLVQIPVFLSW